MDRIGRRRVEQRRRRPIRSNANHCPVHALPLLLVASFPPRGPGRIDFFAHRPWPAPPHANFAKSDRYLFLITVGIGTKPVKVNFWTRLFSGFSGVTSAVYRLPFESTDKWCSVPNCPAAEPHDPNESRNSSVLRLKIIICAWLRFATYR